MNVYRDGHVSILHFGWKSRVWLSLDHSFKSFTKILFHWSCGKYIPGLLVSLEVTHVFLETTSTVFHFENPNAVRFKWWGWEEQVSIAIRRLSTRLTEFWRTEKLSRVLGTEHRACGTTQTDAVYSGLRRGAHVSGTWNSIQKASECELSS